MRRTLWLAMLVVASVALLGLYGMAAQVTEVGLLVHVMHDPLRSGGEVRLAAAVAAYGRLAIADGWTMRAEVGGPIDLFLPQLGIAVSRALGGRWAVEGQLWAQTDFQDSLYFSLNAGGRVLLAGSPSSHVLLSSFPLALVGLWFWPGSVSVLPTAGLNAYLDVAWTPSSNLLLGQSIGVSLARLGPDREMAFPLGELYGLVFDSMTRVGYRP